MSTLSKYLWAVILVSNITITAARAEDTNGEPHGATSNPYSTASGIHFLLHGGLTYGGDTIATVSYTNGGSKDFKGGALWQFGAGGLYQFENTPLALVMSFNYHIDLTVGKNGDAQFGRFPIEMLAYYTGKDRFRFGGGVRIVNSPEYSQTIDGLSEKITFDNTTGLVAELGYEIGPKVWLSFRMVSEKYKANSVTIGGSAIPVSKEFNGSHMGANFTFLF